MFVQCLGSGDAFGSGGRLNTCFYIKTTGQEILLDCGASTLGALKKEGMSAHQIDMILITHLHGDHFGGLPFILCEITALKARKKRLTIVGPPGLREKTLMVLQSFYPGVEVDDRLVNFVTYEAKQTLRLGDVLVTPYQVIHSPESNPH
jgi:ribonuclease BN (tRNA processing enzyme)